MPRKKKEVAEVVEKAVETGELVKEEVEEKAAATEIEVKKNVRKAGRKAKEAVETIAASDAVVAAEIEVKKAARKAGRKAKETAVKAADKVVKTAEKGRTTAKKAVLNIIIQSPMGGIITPDDIAKKVPKGTKEVYVRVDENKLYYVLKDGSNGDVDIWE